MGEKEKYVNRKEVLSREIPIKNNRGSKHQSDIEGATL